MLKIKRIYEPTQKEDGFRVLADRLWPRGVTKEKAHLDLWLKEIAPSNDLRKWFGHDPKKWDEFKKKYLKELEKSPQLEQLKKLEKENKVVTLLYAAKDTEHNEAVVLLNFFQ